MLLTCHVRFNPLVLGKTVVIYNSDAVHFRSISILLIQHHQEFTSMQRKTLNIDSAFIIAVILQTYLLIIKSLGLKIDLLLRGSHSRKLASVNHQANTIL